MLDSLPTHDWDFPVEMQPVFDQYGNEIHGAQAVVRTDTEQALKVHGSKYELVRHDDVVNSVMDGIQQADISNDYDMKVSTIEGGRRLRMEVMFNNLVAEPAVGDYVKFRINALNSYDASWPFLQEGDAYRLWCLNGCTTPKGVARYSYKHTANINVAGIAARIEKAVEFFLTRQDEWKSWMNVMIDDQFVNHFFSKTLAWAKPASNGMNKVNERQMANLTDLWTKNKQQLGSNKWALYNTMTEWSTHVVSDTPLVTQRSRETQVQNALVSQQWKLLP